MNYSVESFFQPVRRPVRIALQPSLNAFPQMWNSSKTLHWPVRHRFAFLYSMRNHQFAGDQIVASYAELTTDVDGKLASIFSLASNQV